MILAFLPLRLTLTAYPLLLNLFPAQTLPDGSRQREKTGYEDRHPRGMNKDDPDFDEKLMHEKQQDSKEKRDRNDGIPQDMLDSKDPYQEFTSADQTDTNRI